MDLKKVNKDAELTEEVKRYIDRFSSKKRLEVMDTLYPNRKLAHGELAKAVNTSPASLSNILLNFESFDYILIDSVSEGKRRCYYLTKLGRDYVESNRRLEKGGDKVKTIRGDSFQMLQKAKEHLNEFQALEDDWEFELEEALIARIECQRIPESESQKAVDEFIRCTECVLVSDYDHQIMNVLKLLQDNSILRIRFSRFIEKFDLFRPVLEIWENGIDALQMYEFLDAAIFGRKDETQDCVNTLQMDEAYDKLAKGISYIAEKTGGTDMTALYECFNRYLAGNQIVSGFLAKEVFGSMMKKTCNDEEKVR